LAGLGKMSSSSQMQNLYESLVDNALSGLVSSGISYFLLRRTKDDANLLGALEIPRYLYDGIMTTASGMGSDYIQTQAQPWLQEQFSSDSLQTVNMIGGPVLTGGIAVGIDAIMPGNNYGEHYKEVALNTFLSTGASKWIGSVAYDAFNNMITQGSNSGDGTARGKFIDDTRQRINDQIDRMRSREKKRKRDSSYSAHKKIQNM